MVVGLLVAKRFIYLIITPMMAVLHANDLDERLYYTSPCWGVSLIINLGLIWGSAIAMPWVLDQIWLFVSRGFYKDLSAAPSRASSARR